VGRGASGVVMVMVVVGVGAGVGIYPALVDFRISRTDMI